MIIGSSGPVESSEPVCVQVNRFVPSEAIEAVDPIGPIVSIGSVDSFGSIRLMN